MLFNATNPAAYSLLPPANSFQTITIAIHLAEPIRINPIRYSGLSLRKIIPRININKGPTIQLRIRETLNTFLFLNTLPILLYLTFASGGYIIRISPMARGIFVVPFDIELILSDISGKKYPIPTPITIARNIQSVR